jgi:tetratricopeptide (TPR) repeat protein/tRNA A-37 threonylcarbamoyl transferase component Bud32
MATPAAATEGSPFEPGAVFAGRYRLIARLGLDRSGELWRAEDLVLGTPIALKVLSVSSPEARERMLEEVRLARQVTHPAVCRVFDVGDSGSSLFYTMELVHGEDLNTVLRRVGRLPSEKVIDIGRQLCAGLGAAHLEGVRHGALTKASVLIDADGLVRITDFGTSSQASDGGAGSAAAMAADIHAAVRILYELLAGTERAEGAARAGATRTASKDSGTLLDRVLLKALAADSASRPSTAAELAALLEGPAPARDRRLQTWAAGIALAAIVVLAVVAIARLLPRGGRTLTDKDVIVLADFQNTTGEAVFDGALKVALAVALEQSPFLKVFPDEVARDTLRLMQRDPNAPITRQVAREIAQREGLSALVAGSIGRLGNRYVLALEAINPQTGDVIAREQTEVAAREDLIRSLGSTTSQLRQKLGESLASIQRFDAPLPRATTPSLDALHAYALALEDGRIVPRPEGIPHLQRALELDPDFAMAHALLSGVYANIGRTAEAPEHSRRAFELRDRVSERERFFISWRYYIDALQAWDRALELARSWTSTYPREAFAFNSLGLATAAFGQHDEAVAAFRRATELDPRFGAPYSNLIGSLVALNRFGEAAPLAASAATRGLDTNGVRRNAYVLAFLRGDTAAMSRELERSRDRGDSAATFEWEAKTKAFAGQLHAAHTLFQRAIERAIGGGQKEAAAQWTMQDAEAQAIAGQCGEVARTVTEALALSRDNFTLERGSRTLALCRSEGSRTLLDELGRRYPEATLTARVHRPVIGAIAELNRGNAAGALELLEGVRPYAHAPAAELWPSYLRGEALLRLKDGTRAGRAFQDVLDRRGEAPDSLLYALAQLGRARAAAAAGDPGDARTAYDAFFALWRAADPGLTPLVEARQQYARLR